MLATRHRDDEEALWRAALVDCVNGRTVQYITPLTAFRAARRSLGLSITAFATLLGIYPGAALCWEQGRKPIPTWVMGRLQSHLAAREPAA